MIVQLEMSFEVVALLAVDSVVPVATVVPVLQNLLIWWILKKIQKKTIIIIVITINSSECHRLVGAISDLCWVRGSITIVNDLIFLNRSLRRHFLILTVQ